MNLAQELSWRVQAGMRRHDMTQRELAAKAGITEKHLSKMLNCRKSSDHTAYPTGSLVMWDQLLNILGQPVKEKLK